MVTTPGRDDSPAASYDPMRQFAELAGDVRDPYPMFAGIRADSPVLHVHLDTGSGARYEHDPDAPPITSLFAVTSHELAQQVLTDNARFSSAANAMTIGQVMGRTILEMDPPEHQRHRALVARAFRARVLGRDHRPDGLPELRVEPRAHPPVGVLDDAIQRDGQARYDLPHGGLLENHLRRPALWSGLLLTLRTGTGQMDTAAELSPGGPRCGS